MKQLALSSIAAALAALLVLVLVVARDPDAAAAPAAQAPVAPPRASPRVARGEVDTAPSPAPRRAAVAAADEGEASPRPLGIPHRVVARLVDEQGAPIARAELAYHASEGVDTARAGADGVVELDVHLAAAAVSSETQRIDARHPRFATRELRVSLRPDEPTWLGDVVLIPGASIAGRVEDTGAGTEVWAYPGPDRVVARRHRPPGRAMTATDPDGAYRIDGLLPGTYTIVAVSKERFAGKAPGIEAACGVVAEAPPLRLARREPEDSIEGRVAAADGGPLERVRLEAIEIDLKGRSHGKRWREVDVAPDGAFRIELDAPSDVRAVAWVPGVTAGAWARRLEPGERDVELRVPPVRHAVVEVVDRETDEPIANQRITVKLVVEAEQEDRDDRTPNWVASREYGELRTDEEGRVAIAEPGQVYWIYLQGRSWSGLSSVQHPREREEDAAEPHVIPIGAWMSRSRRESLAKAAAGPPEPVEVEAISGRVLRNGRPVAGARVTAHNASAPGTHKLVPVTSAAARDSAGPYERRTADEARRAQSAYRPFAVFARGRDGAVAVTDEAGTFELTEALETLHEWVVLRAEAPGLASGVVGPLRKRDLLGYDPDAWDKRVWSAALAGDAPPPAPVLARPRRVQIDVVETGALEGELWLPAGVDPSGRVVAVSRGDGVALATTVSPGGRYRFENLPAGPWQVREIPRGRERRVHLAASRSDSPLASPIPWDRVVEPGRVTTYGLDLSAGACEVWGVVRIPGIESDGMRVRVLADGQRLDVESTRHLASTTVVGEEFHVEIPHAGAVWIELRTDDFVSWSPFALETGANQVAIELPTGELRWEAPAAARDQDVALFWRGPSHLARWSTPGGHRGERRGLSREEGIEFGAIPAGRVEVVLAVPSLGGTSCGFVRPVDSTEFGPPPDPPPAFGESASLSDGTPFRAVLPGGRTVVGELVLRAGESRSATPEQDGVD